MMKTMVFRITTGIAGAYHLILGTALWLLPADALTGTVRLFLGANLDVDPRMSLVARFCSSYVLVFGIMLVLLCLNPVRYRVLAIPALVLFGVRLVNKIVLHGAIEQALGVGRGRSAFAVATLAVIFGLIALTLPRCGETRES